MAHPPQSGDARPALPRARRPRRPLRGISRARDDPALHVHRLHDGRVEDPGAHRARGGGVPRLGTGRARHRVHHGQRVLHHLYRWQRDHHRRHRRAALSDDGRQRVPGAVRARGGDDERLGRAAPSAVAADPRVLARRGHRLQQGVQVRHRAGNARDRDAERLRRLRRGQKSHPAPQVRRARSRGGPVGGQVGDRSSVPHPRRAGDRADPDRRGRRAGCLLRDHHRGLRLQGSRLQALLPDRSQLDGPRRWAPHHHDVRHGADELHDQRADPRQDLRLDEQRRDQSALAVSLRAESVPLRHGDGWHQHDPRERAAHHTVCRALRDSAVPHVHHVSAEPRGM